MNLRSQTISHKYNKQNKSYIDIYTGLLNSTLFTASEKLLLIYLLANSNEKTDTINTAQISVKRLSENSGMSRATIHRHMKVLEQKGVLLKKNNFSIENGNTANTYSIINYTAVWDSTTLEELKEKTNNIKSEVLLNG